MSRASFSTSIMCDTGAPWYPPTYETPDCSSAFVTARIPSPWKVSPSPSLSFSTSSLNERSISADLRRQPGRYRGEKKNDHKHRKADQHIRYHRAVDVRH